MSVQETLLSLNGHHHHHRQHHPIIEQLSTLYTQISSTEAHAFLKQPLRAELAKYQRQLIGIERQLLTHHAGLVPGTSRATPLSAIIAELHPATHILQALAELIHDTNSHPQTLTLLIQRVHRLHARSGNPHIQALFARFQASLELRWLILFRESLIYGHQPPTPLDLPLLPALQPFLPLANSLQHISHARNILDLLLHQHRSSHSFLPPSLQELLRNALANIHSLSHPSFRLAIRNIQEILSNYLFSTYLTPEILNKTMGKMTDIFLMRGATFTGNLVAGMKQLEGRHGGRVTRRELEVVLLKAGMNTEEEEGRGMDLEGFTLGLMGAGSGTASVFNRAILSSRTNHEQAVQLCYTPPPGLSLLLSAQICRRYSAIHACLLAFRMAQQSCTDVWRLLAHKDRLRSRLSSVVHPADHEQEQAWRQLARLAFEALRRVGWFMTTMLDYFMQDVVAPSMGELGQEGRHDEPAGAMEDWEAGSREEGSSGEFLLKHGRFLGRIEAGLGVRTDEGQEETEMSVRLGAVLEASEALLGAVEGAVEGGLGAGRMLADDSGPSSAAPGCPEQRQLALAALLPPFDRALRRLILLLHESDNHSHHIPNNSFQSPSSPHPRAAWHRLAAKLNFNAWFLPAQ